jgi:hypothetical protein
VSNSPAQALLAARVPGRPFEKGNRGGPGNPFAGEVARFRADLWKATTPERRGKLVDILWKKALGEFEVAVEELEINPRTNKPFRDRRTTTKMVKEQPQPWAMHTLLNRLLGKEVQGVYEADPDGTPVEEGRMQRLAEILAKHGLADRIPHQLKAPPPPVVAESPPLKRKKART